MKVIVRNCALAVVIVASMQVAVAAKLDKILERGAIEVAAYDNFPPYSYKVDGRRAGIDVEIAEAIAAKLKVGLVVRLVGVDENMGDDLRNNVWKGHYIGTGPADMMLHVPFNHENSFSKDNDLIRFLAPYYRETMAMATHPDLTAFTAVEQLQDERVAVELDTLADFFLSSERAGDKRENAMRYPNLESALDDFSAGKVQALFGPRGEIQGLLSRAGIKAEVREVELPGFDMQAWDVGFAIRFNYQPLIEEVLVAVTELREEGKIAEIFSAHGVDYIAPSPRALKFGYQKVVEREEDDD